MVGVCSVLLWLTLCAVVSVFHWVKALCSFKVKWQNGDHTCLSWGRDLQTSLLISCLIQPSYQTRATIFKVFFLQLKSNNSCFNTKIRILISSKTCKFSSRTWKLYFSLWIHVTEKTLAEFFNIMQSLVPWACKQGIKSKAEAINYCR